MWDSLKLKSVLTSVLVLACAYGARAKEGYYSAYDFAGHAVFTISNAADVVASGVPLWITIKEGSPAGFKYSDLKNDGLNGVRFIDESGKALDYEPAITNVNGESGFWVRVPTLREGAKITMCWNLRDGADRTMPTNDPYAVWSDYLGVWHFDESVGSAETSKKAADATGNGLSATPTKGTYGNLGQMVSRAGAFGRGRINASERKTKGNHFEMPFDDVGSVFTLSCWAQRYLNNNSPLMFASRKSKVSSGDGWAAMMQSGGTTFDIYGNAGTKAILAVLPSAPAETVWSHFALVYSNTTVYVYCNGVLKGSKPIVAVVENGLPMMLGGGDFGSGSTSYYSWYGAFDEVRLSSGSRSAEQIAIEYMQGTNALYAVGAATNDTQAVLKNGWKTQPTITQTTWEAPAHPTLADFDLGTPGHGTATIAYYDRATGALLEGIPTTVGEYRAVVTVAQAEEAGATWGALESTLTFRIVANSGTKGFGKNIGRILLMNDDYTVDDGEVEWQSYTDEDGFPGFPFWQHLADDHETDESLHLLEDEEDDWSEWDFNIGGGSYHVYSYRDADGEDTRYWTLDGVRVGNTFRNGADYPGEEDDQGLSAVQNYLPWNPGSQRVVGYTSDTVGKYHRYVGHALMQNKADASIVSSCYTNGIGTIYFDAVNGWTDNVTNELGEANYQLVVEIATNRLESTEAPTDENISSNPDRGISAPDPFRYADWKPCTLRVLRFDEGVCTDLGEQEALNLDIENGGSYRHFYRVIVPVNTVNTGLFRIRRTAIDDDYRSNPDGDAYILVDNVICSTPTKYVNLSPCGAYFSDKTGKRVLGREGAFDPAFPAATDGDIYGRAQATMSDGSSVPAGWIAAATMHYRWHYLEQQTLGWQTVDLEPATLRSVNKLELRPFQGDIDFWFDLTQNGAFYQYADYSGTGLELGTSGYTEEITAVTNRAAGVDWFVRTRDGKSDYAEVKIVVKASESAPEHAIDMYVADNQMWRGFYRMTNVFENGILWRIEPRNRQENNTAWSWNTNYWYVIDWDESEAKLPTFPATGRLSAGTTNSWSRMPCDMQTGYLMFQLDESSLGVTVTRADYQDFNQWSDAAKGYFVGSSSDTNAMSGTSADARRYVANYAGHADTPATNKNWNLDFNGTIGYGIYADSYHTFVECKDTFGVWDLGKGMWVHGKYREPKSNVALQMAGCGEGYAEFSNQSQLGDNWPRGFESVSFNARIAQPTPSPDGLVYDMTAFAKTNYTFMTRVCFDMKANKGFSGNASLSLFAYYCPGVGAYEARWEQIGGVLGSNTAYPNDVLEPQKGGQRLVLSRWDAVGSTYQETMLFAATNRLDIWNGTKKTTISNFGVDMPTMPYDGKSSATNNLMPFFISVIRQDGKNVIVAGIRTTLASQTTTSHGGVAWNDNTSNFTKNWYFAYAIDNTGKTPFNFGSYGVLSANCEGMFLTPQFRESGAYPSSLTPAAIVKAGKNGYKSDTINDATKFVNCYDPSGVGWLFWTKNPGRETAFGGKSSSQPFGFTYVKPSQTILVETATLNGSDWTKIGEVAIEDFGQPGREAAYVPTFHYASDCKLRLRTGGDTDAYRTDVAIYDIAVRQWRGDRNLTTTEERKQNYTNFVYTSGWMTNGAVQLSAKRTATGSSYDPCTIRSPLFDGYDGRGRGLGSLSFSYREPDTNVSILVQFATNVTYSTIDTMTKTKEDVPSALGDGCWFTVTNLHYKELWQDIEASNADGTKTWSGFNPGFHGVRGVMRIIVNPELVEALDDLSKQDVSAFGAIEITSIACEDEPPLDRKCWWGWNIQTMGDVTDTQKRMYLPDGSSDLAACGRSIALNNSITAGVDPTVKTADIRQHMPFVQSPTFTNAVIGQISFKARKYELSDLAPTAKVVVYGATRSPDDLLEDNKWVRIEEFPITNTIYTTFTCKTDAQSFYALRLGVEGVPGTENPPAAYDPSVQRVLIDEVAISEAVRAMLAFRNVGAFRDGLNNNLYVQGVTTKEQQPLCDESWGVQAELCATMLGEEIDKSYEPQVKLHWYVGKEPWGFANWRKKETGCAPLAQTEGSNWVYRSSYSAALAAVMPPQSTPGTVVQYMLEVVYRTSTVTQGKTTHSTVTNWLDSTSWSAPSWFAPVDYNTDAEVNPNGGFAAFTILDTVAPGWAWINEVNVFGTKSTSGANSDEQFQYVEVCVPMEADLTGWRLRFLEAGVYNDTVTTNWIAKFGKTIWDQAPATKSANVKFKKTFRCLGNKESDKLKKSDGSLDGVWQFSQYTSTFRNRDGVDCIYDFEQPFGIQLVRSSGVIESSVVVIGTNRWGRLPGYREYDPSNTVAKLNQLVPGSKFFYASEDSGGTFRSSSVTSGQGESAGVWTNDWACSPGYVNTNWGGKVMQVIGDHPTPHGDNIIVYFTIDSSGGPIRQFVGGKGSSATNATEMIVLPKDSVIGTNVLYQVDPWYEIAGVTTNDTLMWYEPRIREKSITVGVGASNNIEVVAKAQVDSDLRGYGLTADNPFTPAVMAWLRGGKDAFGHKFAHDGEIAPLARYWDIAGNDITNLTLTQMYVLDMDPTVSNLVFQAGMLKTWPVIAGVDPNDPVKTDYKGTAGLTNTRMRVFMMISNRVEAVGGPDGASRAWSPYILRGYDPDFTSWNYESGGVVAQSWTGATFKVTGILANGLTRESNADNWIALRWFVFHEDSFVQPADESADHPRFTTDIEIVDPHSISSPGAAAGWYDWCQEHGYTPIFNRWAIDLGLKPVGVEVLKTENFFDTP